MAEVIWAEPALTDLEDIAQYIDVSNSAAAQRLVAKIFDAVQRLDHSPESGKEVAELQGLGYREVLVNPCRVLYKFDGARVVVLHVFRQERDLKRFILTQ